LARAWFLFGILLAVFMTTACPKRQTMTRVVYVPLPPAPSTSAPSTDALVIEAPPPPEPEPAAQEAPAPEPPKPPVHHRPPIHNPPVSDDARPESAKAEAPEPEEAPALVLQSSAEQQTELLRNATGERDDVRRRIAHLDTLQLSAEERRTLNGARAFLAQSESALKEDDPQRSINLTRKAALLVSSVEQNH
jgi:hypothetical protein